MVERLDFNILYIGWWDWHPKKQRNWSFSSLHFMEVSLQRWLGQGRGTIGIVGDCCIQGPHLWGICSQNIITWHVYQQALFCLMTNIGWLFCLSHLGCLFLSDGACVGCWMRLSHTCTKICSRLQYDKHWYSDREPEFSNVPMLVLSWNWCYTIPAKSNDAPQWVGTLCCACWITQQHTGRIWTDSKKGGYRHVTQIACSVLKAEVIVMLDSLHNSLWWSIWTLPHIQSSISTFVCLWLRSCHRTRWGGDPDCQWCGASAESGTHELWYGPWYTDDSTVCTDEWRSTVLFARKPGRGARYVRFALPKSFAFVGIECPVGIVLWLFVACDCVQLLETRTKSERQQVASHRAWLLHLQCPCPVPRVVRRRLRVSVKWGSSKTGNWHRFY